MSTTYDTARERMTELIEGRAKADLARALAAIDECERQGLPITVGQPRRQLSADCPSTWPDVIEQVLRDAAHPLTVREIAQAALALGQSTGNLETDVVRVSSTVKLRAAARGWQHTGTRPRRWWRGLVPNEQSPLPLQQERAQ